jgi:hypothetical protein
MKNYHCPDVRKYNHFYQCVVGFDMAFKLELAQVSSVFTPIDVKLFECNALIESRFVFLFTACKMSEASSSFKRL